MIIDAWAQHPTLRHLRDPIFDSEPTRALFLGQNAAQIFGLSA